MIGRTGKEGADSGRNARTNRSGAAASSRYAVRSERPENVVLKDIALFFSLGDEELRQIRSHILLREFRKSQTILHEEETTEYMYIIIQGKVKISRIGRDGKETILSMHGSGEFFGELSLIDGRTAPANVVAVEHSSVAIISKAVAVAHL